MKKIKQLNPWQTYSFECKECGANIGHTSRSVVKKDICGICEDNVAEEC